MKVKAAWERVVETIRSLLERLKLLVSQTFMRSDTLSQQEMDDSGSGSKPYTLISKLAAEFVGDLLFIFIGTCQLNGLATW